MKYWLYLNGEVPGTFSATELAALPGVIGATLVCPCEGNILEKNWRPCSDFPEIARTLQERDQKEAAAKAAEGGTGPAASQGAVSQFFDSGSQRLFQHVNDLMRELDKRRGDERRIAELERQIADLKEQLRRAQDL